MIELTKAIAHSRQTKEFYQKLKCIFMARYPLLRRGQGWVYSFKSTFYFT